MLKMAQGNSAQKKKGGGGVSSDSPKPERSKERQTLSYKVSNGEEKILQPMPGIPYQTNVRC